MITHDQIESLLTFQPQGELVASFYLNADLRERNAEAQRIAAKTLISRRRQELEEMDLPQSERRAVLEDLDRLKKFTEAELSGSHSFRGLVVISAGDSGLWQVYRLARPVKDALVIDRHPYVRPLTVILDEYHRFATLLVDRQDARLFELYMGEILEHEQVFDEVPGRVRIAGWYGLEERRIERHIEDHVHWHYTKVANLLFRHFKLHRFDYLILGGHVAELPVFESHLHPYLRQRLVGRFHAEPEPKMTPINRVKEESLRIEAEFERQQELALVRDVIDKAKSGGMGVLGLENTLPALLQGAVHTLVIDDEWTAPGAVCPECGFVSHKGSVCPVCSAEMNATDDVIEEAIEVAAQRGAFVEHVFANSPLAQEGHVGALLRFRPIATRRARG